MKAFGAAIRSGFDKAVEKFSWRWLIWAALVLSIGALLFSFALECFMHFLYFNGYAANGAFQLMNPLTRMANGQFLGRDFQFFHGAGVPLVHYPLFALFGEGLFGSEMSRWFTSFILFAIVSLAFIILWFRGQKLKDRFTVICISFLLIFAVTSSVADVIMPSNSLLGIRTTMPFVIAMLMLCRDKLQSITLGYGKYRANVYTLAVAFSLALAVLMGTEHGIASALAFTAVELLRVIINRKPRLRSIIRPEFLRELLPLLGVLCLTVVFLLVLSTIISAGHPVSILKYALVTVPSDQFWYFGAEPQGYLKSGSLSTQLNNPTIHPLYFAALFSLLFYYMALREKLLTKRQWLVTVFLSLYGILTLSSLLGYYTPVMQIHGLMRALVLIDCLIFMQLIVRTMDSTTRPYRSASIAAAIVITATISLTAFSDARHFDVHQILKQAYLNMRGDHSGLLAPAWSERLDSFQPYIEQAKKSPGTPLWSTYASLYERQNGLTQPSSDGCDYIIHCLGKERHDQYAKDFIDKKPTLAATLRPRYFTFEEWLWDRHADFYEQLIENYDIVAQNDSHLLWKHSATANISTKAEQPLNISNGTVDLPTSAEATSQVIKVTVRYRTDPTYGQMPFLNKLPRYLLQPIGTVSSFAISLPPSENEWSFLLVLADGNAKQQLHYFADGLLPDAKLSVDKATYKPLPVDDKERAYFNEKLEIEE